MDNVTEPLARKLICETCQKTFNKWSIFKRHSAIHVKMSKEKVTTRKKHSMTMAPPLEEGSNSKKGKRKTNICVYCDKTFHKPSDLERHVKTHTNERSFSCSKADCSKSFSLKSTLKRHFRTHDKLKFECNVCQSDYQSVRSLQNHMRIHHTQIQLYLFPTDPESRHDVQANEEITENKSAQLSDLLSASSSPPQHSSTIEINHVEIGNEENVGATDEIDEATEPCISPQKHQPKMEFNCQHCMKSFKKPIDLRRHSDAVHDKKRPFKCFVAQCDKSFSLQCTLNRHMDTHKEKRLLVTCETCSKVLSTKSSLILHKRIHENLKPHRCIVCGLTFRTSGNLRSHLKIHTKNTNCKSSFKVS